VTNRSGLTEKHLIKAVKGNDRIAFRQLVESYSDFAFSVAFRVINDQDDAKDIVQEAFIKVWEKRVSIKHNGSFKWWLRKVIVNSCYDLLRKRKRQTWNISENDQRLMQLLISDEETDKNLTNSELSAVIRTLTGKLSPKQKLVFTLLEIEGLSHDEIAETTGMNKESIKSNLFHARKEICRMIKKYL
jgi:RNA polymerase sigma-70 factor (ECF subfamily)